MFVPPFAPQAPQIAVDKELRAHLDVLVTDPLVRARLERALDTPAAALQFPNTETFEQAALPPEAKDTKKNKKRKKNATLSPSGQNTSTSSEQKKNYRLLLPGSRYAMRVACAACYVLCCVSLSSGEGVGSLGDVRIKEAINSAGAESAPLLRDFAELAQCVNGRFNPRREKGLIRDACNLLLGKFIQFRHAREPERNKNRHLKRASGTSDARTPTSFVAAQKNILHILTGVWPFPRARGRPRDESEDRVSKHARTSSSCSFSLSSVASREPTSPDASSSNSEHHMPSIPLQLTENEHATDDVQSEEVFIRILNECGYFDNPSLREYEWPAYPVHPSGNHEHDGIVHPHPVDKVAHRQTVTWGVVRDEMYLVTVQLICDHVGLSNLPEIIFQLRQLLGPPAFQADQL